MAEKIRIDEEIKQKEDEKKQYENEYNEKFLNSLIQSHSEQLEQYESKDLECESDSDDSDIEVPALNKRRKLNDTFNRNGSIYKNRSELKPVVKCECEQPWRKVDVSNFI